MEFHGQQLCNLHLTEQGGLLLWCLHRVQYVFHL